MVARAVALIVASIAGFVTPAAAQELSNRAFRIR
jgi:hypothetical protein